MNLPTTEVDLGPEKIEDEKEGGPLVHCDLFDTEVVHKVAQMMLPGLATACVDNTTGDIFKTPGSVAAELRDEMVDYLTMRSETFVAESIILEGGPDAEISDHPYDIISDFVDDFASSKRNIFSRVSNWLLSDNREDKIDDFVQEMEMNGFWLLEKRESLAETLLKNVDFKNSFHCGMKFNSAEELVNHVYNCSFRSMICTNEGCYTKFCARLLEKHDSTCPFKIIPCEQKCSDSVMRREMDRHCITVCPMKLTNCPFYAVGCRSAIPQCKTENHCADNLHSHLLYTLQGIHKEASVDDLPSRVEQIIQASSNSRLQEARDIRSFTFIAKDLDSKLGPLEVNAKKKNSADNINDRNKDSEDSDNEKRGSEQSTQISNMENSSNGAEVIGIMDKDSSDNDVENESSEHSHIENKGSEETTLSSNVESLSDKAEVSAMDKNSGETYNKNGDASDSNLDAKGNEEYMQTSTTDSPEKGEVSAPNKDNAEKNIKNKDIEVNDFKNNDNLENIQTEKMGGKVNADNNIKDKDIDDRKFEVKGSDESIWTSKAMKEDNDKKRETVSAENLSDKAEV